MGRSFLPAHARQDRSIQAKWCNFCYITEFFLPRPWCQIDPPQKSEIFFPTKDLLERGLSEAQFNAKNWFKDFEEIKKPPETNPEEQSQAWSRHTNFQGKIFARFFFIKINEDLFAAVFFGDPY